MLLNQAMKLYKVWVSFSEDDVDTETRAIEIRREGEVDHTDGVGFEVGAVSPAGPEAPGGGSLPPPPNPKREARPKTEKSAVQQAKQAR